MLCTGIREDEKVAASDLMELIRLLALALVISASIFILEVVQNALGGRKIKRLSLIQLPNYEIIIWPIFICFFIVGAAMSSYLTPTEFNPKMTFAISQFYNQIGNPPEDDHGGAEFSS